MPFTRLTACPWFLPSVFSCSFRLPSSEVASSWATRQKVTAYETTMRGDTPRLKSASVLRTRLRKASPCFGRLLASPLQAVCLSVCGCSVGVVGAFRCFGTAVARQGTNDRERSFIPAFNYGRKVAVLSRARRVLRTLDHTTIFRGYTLAKES